jgi:hypothetical protein
MQTQNSFTKERVFSYLCLVAICICIYIYILYQFTFPLFFVYSSPGVFMYLLYSEMPLPWRVSGGESYLQSLRLLFLFLQYLFVFAALNL